MGLREEAGDDDVELDELGGEFWLLLLLACVAIEIPDEDDDDEDEDDSGALEVGEPAEDDSSGDDDDDEDTGELTADELPEW